MRTGWGVTLPPRAHLPDKDLVLHAAAWTDVDAAETQPQDAAAVNVPAGRSMPGSSASPSCSARSS